MRAPSPGPSRAEIDAMLEADSTPSPTSPFAPWLRSSGPAVGEPEPLSLPEPIQPASQNADVSVPAVLAEAPAALSPIVSHIRLFGFHMGSISSVTCPAALCSASRT